MEHYIVTGESTKWNITLLEHQILLNLVFRLCWGEGGKTRLLRGGEKRKEKLD